MSLVRCVSKRDFPPCTHRPSESLDPLVGRGSAALFRFVVSRVDYNTLVRFFRAANQPLVRDQAPIQRSGSFVAKWPLRGIVRKQSPGEEDF